MFFSLCVFTLGVGKRTSPENICQNTNCVGVCAYRISFVLPIGKMIKGQKDIGQPVMFSLIVVRAGSVSDRQLSEK